MKNNTLASRYFLDNCLDEYCSGIFSDELDKLGYKHQVTANWHLNNSRLRLFGMVRTLELEEVETADERIEKGLHFLGNLDRDEVILIKGSSRFAYFGELMTRLSCEIGVGGSIIDGLTRDSFYTQTSSLPIFSKGYTPVDIKGRGRVKDTDISLNIDGIDVNSGDFVFADSDAVVFIPKSIFPKLLSKINEAALEEMEIKVKINEGMSIKNILLNHKEF